MNFFQGLPALCFCTFFSATIEIGSYNNSKPFLGRMSHLCLWNRVLDEFEDIQSLSNDKKNFKKVNDERGGLIGCFDMDAPTGEPEDPTGNININIIYIIFISNI